MNMIEFNGLKSYDFVKCIFTTNEVDMKNEDDVKNVCSKYNFTYENLTFNKQIHSDIIRVIKKEDIGVICEGDGIITSLKNVPILSFVADCASIGVIDKNKKVIGIVHSGWRGTYEKIVYKLIEKMKKEFFCSEKDLICVMGPCINECCYEVGADLIEKFNTTFTNINKDFYIIKEGKYFLNLQSINIHILKEIGILKENILISNECTCCSQNLHSYRRDNKTLKRMALILELV